MWRLALAGVLAFSHLPRALCASSFNVTVDDQYGDPKTGLSVLYDPTWKWADGQSCTNCSALPDATKAYMQTWKTATYGAGDTTVQASVPFTGVAVYVSCILTGSIGETDGNTDLTFYIDNEKVGTYQQPPTEDISYQYGVSVFSKEGLSNELHTLTLTSGSSGNDALVMLDSITYTIQQTDTLPSTTVSSLSFGTDVPLRYSNRSTNHSAAIAGGVVGSLAALAILGALAVVLCRRRKQNHRRFCGTRIMLDRTNREIPAHYSCSEARVTPFILDRKGSMKSQVSSLDSCDRTSFWTEVKLSMGAKSIPETEDVDVDVSIVANAGRSRTSRNVGESARPVMMVPEGSSRNLRQDVYDDLKPPAYTYNGISTSQVR